MTYTALQAGRYGAGTPFDWPVAIGYERAPFASFPAGAFQNVAGPVGVAFGIFGWVNAAGQVANARAADTDQLVFVIPTRNAYNWQRVYPSYPVGSVCNVSGYPSDPYVNHASYVLWVIRAGIETVCETVGSFNVRFPVGGQVGSQVWADPATGFPYDANVTGSYLPTPWTLMQSGGAGAALRIASFTPPL